MSQGHPCEIMEAVVLMFFALFPTLSFSFNSTQWRMIMTEASFAVGVEDPTGSGYIPRT